MLSLERCKEILNSTGNKYSDIQVQLIREILYQLANIERKQLKKKENEERDYLHKGINR